jgi:hypothetical protein
MSVRKGSWVQGLGVACLLGCGVGPLSAESSLPPPQPLVRQVMEPVFDQGEPAYFKQVYGCWATPTAVIGLVKVERDGKLVDLLQYWNAEGDGVAVERPGPGQDALVVRGERVYARHGPYGGWLGVWDRASTGPALPQLPSGWNFATATDQALVLRKGWSAAEIRHLQFFNLSPAMTLGEVDVGIPVERIIAREQDFVIAGPDTLATMEYPRLVRDKMVKAKVRKVPLKVEKLLHFGPRFAVVQAGRDKAPYFVVWGDKGAARVLKITGLPVQAGARGWAEAAGTVYLTDETGSLFRIVAGEKSAAAEAIGMPAGMAISTLHTGNERSLFVTTVAHRGIQRIEAGRDARWLEVGTISARERDGVLRFPVGLDRPSAEPVTFTYETRPRGATAGEDYTPVSGTATIPPGSTSVVIEVPLLEDFTIEPPETFELHVTGCGGAKCDRPVGTGRILGSGMRLVARGALQGTDEPLFSNQALPASRRLPFPAGEADAGSLGFASLSPITGNSGRYFYARGNPLDAAQAISGFKPLCRFDAFTGELLDLLPVCSRWRIDGEQVLIATGTPEFERYGFFDGLPLPEVTAGTLRENGGPQGIGLMSERSRLPLDFVAESPDPALGLVEFVSRETGEIEIRADPPDDSLVHFSRKIEFAIRTTDREAGTTSRAWVALDLADDDFAYTSFVPAGRGYIDGLATDGQRIWTGRNGGDRMGSFVFADGKLTPDIIWHLPEKSSLSWIRTPAGQPMATDGSRLVSAWLRSGKLSLVSLSAEAPAKKDWQSKSAPPVAALVFAGEYLAAGSPSGTAGVPGKVTIFQASSGKPVRVIEAPDGEPAFGYSLAYGGGLLWIASPRAGIAAGEVHGYSLEDFSRVRTVTSPEPGEGGVFGISIAADDGFLVIGEPTTSAGAVWVFDATGSVLRRRLEASGGMKLPGFGIRVATRGGRFLANGGSIDRNLFPELPAAARSKATTPGTSTSSTPPTDLLWLGYPVVLWLDLDASPRFLFSREGSVSDYDSSREIALLDDCAVYASVKSGSINNAGLQVYAFPPPSASARRVASGSAGPVDPPVWPAADSSLPRWSFKAGPEGNLEVEIDLGAVPASVPDLTVEWSGDLKVWSPVARWTGEASPGGPASAVAADGGRRLRFSFPAGDQPKGFFRLRAPE